MTGEIGDIAGTIIIILLILLIFMAIDYDAKSFCEKNGYKYQGKVFSANECWKITKGELEIRKVAKYDKKYRLIKEE